MPSSSESSHGTVRLNAKNSAQCIQMLRCSKQSLSTSARTVDKGTDRFVWLGIRYRLQRIHSELETSKRREAPLEACFAQGVQGAYLRRHILHATCKAKALPCPRSSALCGKQQAPLSCANRKAPEGRASAALPPAGISKACRGK